MISDVNFSESLDRLKESFLWVAAQAGNAQDCDSLLAIGAQVDWKNSEGDTPLIAACRRGHEKTVTTLLVHGANVNIEGSDGRTPLHIVAERADTILLNKLLECSDVNINTRTRDGQTAYDLAKSRGHTSIINRLRQHSRSATEGYTEEVNLINGMLSLAQVITHFLNNREKLMTVWLKKSVF